MITPTLKPYEIDTAARIQGESVDPLTVWVHGRLRAIAAHSDQMSLQNTSPADIWRYEFHEAKKIVEVVQNGEVEVI